MLNSRTSGSYRRVSTLSSPYGNGDASIQARSTGRVTAFVLAGRLRIGCRLPGMLLLALHRRRATLRRRSARSRIMRVLVVLSMVLRETGLAMGGGVLGHGVAADLVVRDRVVRHLLVRYQVAHGRAVGSGIFCGVRADYRRAAEFPR